jgi:exopolysaccharide biosynthesis polyprenyl glycosylphosphotransferase
VTLFGIVVKRRHLQYLLTDAGAFLLSIEIAHLLGRLWGGPPVHLWTVLQRCSGATLFLASATVLALYLADAYQRSTNYRRRRPHLQLWAAVAGAQVLALVAYRLFPHGWWGLKTALATGICLAALLSLLRYLLCRLSPHTMFPTRLLVIGGGHTAWLTESLIRDDPEHAMVFRLLGFVYAAQDHPRRRHTDIKDGLPAGVAPLTPRLGGPEELVALVEEHQVELIVVAIPGNLPCELTRALLECKTLGATIEEMPTFYKRLTGKIPIQHLSNSWLIFGPSFYRMNRLASGARRIVDIGFALVLGTLALPIVGFFAIAIRLESRGSPIFRQERLGRHERPFQLYKLRTMHEGAERDVGPIWAQPGDQRTTRIGRFLRRTRIDELPQIYNVLVGDMSLVGPRPERAHFVRELRKDIPFYALRFSVKPGLTGWAQVNFGYGGTKEASIEKLRFELYEILELTPAMYLFILLKTAQTVLTRPGS